jgi:hypothetical protein
MANMNNKVCLTHTDTPATSRCITCFRPLCDECIRVNGEDHFCSVECDAKNQKTSSNIENLATPKNHLLGKLIKLAILGAIIYGAYKYKDQITEMFNKSAITKETLDRPI